MDEECLKQSSLENVRFKEDMLALTEESSCGRKESLILCDPKQFHWVSGYEFEEGSIPREKKTLRVIIDRISYLVMTSWHIC